MQIEVKPNTTTRFQNIAGQWTRMYVMALEKNVVSPLKLFLFYARNILLLRKNDMPFLPLVLFNVCTSSQFSVLNVVLYFQFDQTSTLL